MSKEEKGEGFVKWFSELNNKDVPIAGGKGASLAEMYNAKIPVPPGFVITADAYAYFLEKAGINNAIKETLSKLDIQDTKKLNEASEKIRKVMEDAKMPLELEEMVTEAYDILNAESQNNKQASDVLKKSGEDVFVAVRSSATTEDLADASFAGQQETFLNIKGGRDLLKSAKKCMSSLFTPRAIYYRTKKGFKHDQARLAVVVQKMINSVKSGVMFSKNPTRDDGTIVIEAVWGLGEGIVSGQIKPDHYVVSGDLDNFEILEIDISKKKIAIIRNTKGNTDTIKLNNEKAESRVLDNYQVKRLAQYSRILEEHYQKPQDIEFAIDETGIFIVQSRPITTVFKKNEEEVQGEVLLSGLGASPGISSGPVKIVHDLKELEKVKDGDVLVTEMTNPDMVVSMQKAAAIVTDEGGITSHAAIVSREMGIPAVVGTGDATTKLKEGEYITVDGSRGKVYAGKGEKKLIKIEQIVPSRTEIKVIVDLPAVAERAEKSGAKAVGLLRLEGIIATCGKHPVYFVKEKKMNDYIKVISGGVGAIARHFQEVWIRTSDIRTDEYQHLEGAPQQTEGNPMLGDHGIRFSLKHKDIMKAELVAIKEVADDFPEKKFGVMMPQVISVEEVRETKKLAQEIGMPKNVIIGIMVETPAAVQIIEELCKEGIKFASFGTNDLTQYTLAIDRNNEEVQYLYNEMHPAVLSSLKHVIHVCRRYGVKTSICGQAGSRPEMAKFLIENGISSISVNADSARTISMLAADIEGKIGNVADDNQINIQRKENQNNKKHENNITMKKQDDIEEIILKELENDNNEYMPGMKNGKKDIPVLNDSLSADFFNFFQENF